MRITSGILKNRTIISPDTALVRPTSDKVRAAFFSSVGDEIVGARFLDLFAGTGAMGIEAYSRGAAHVTFVEKQPATLQKNLHLLPPEAYTLLKGDIFRRRAEGVTPYMVIGGEFDFIYIDPPYGQYSPADILNAVAVVAIGTVTYELSTREKFDFSQTQFSVIKERKYGDTVLIYLNHK